MKNASKEIDAYIAKAPEFARPILEKFRKAVHAACPEVKEVMKWSAPHFEHHGLLGGMAAFKAHVRYGFWRGKELADPERLLGRVGSTEMGYMKAGKVAEMPTQKVLVAYVKEAAALNENKAEAAKSATKSAKKTSKRHVAKALPVPADLQAALGKHKRARAIFEAFSTSHRNEYVEWIVEAKREATRAKRLAQTLEWLAEGNARNWRYE
ncbi:MAG TPA: YdeI/OmpD-associated family protein [Planctomycetota bacterium]